MQAAPINIISTRVIDAELLQHAANHNINIVYIPFFEIKHIEPQLLQQPVQDALLNDRTAVVFTSANAVQAIGQSGADSLSGKRIYCTKGATLRLVEENFPTATVQHTAKNASELAQAIVSENEQRVCFFCGDNRREELPKLLHENGIEVLEIMVYENIPKPTTIDIPYDGVMFFSPSAANSFFAANSSESTAIYFAIGNTTANALRLYTSRITVAIDPSPNEMVQNVIDCFTIDNKK
jgi:uroporphyrinogen-III synthase